MRENIVRMDKDKFHSLEIKGPILPHVLPSLCHLMKSSHLEEFSASCAHLSTTTSFSVAKHNLGKLLLPSILYKIKLIY